MYVASKMSRDGIFHCPDCCYARRIHGANRIYFHTRQEALKKNYNFCVACSPLMKCYRKERADFESYMMRNRMKMKLNYNDETLYIISANSYWKIMYDDKISQLVLYHRNEMEHTESFSLLPGYHDQNIHSNSLVQIAKYIHKHDLYRAENPWQEMKEPKPGTPYYHRRKKEYEKWRRDVERKQYVRGINQLSEIINKK